MSEGNAGNTTRSRTADDPENRCTKPAPTPTSAPTLTSTSASQPQLHLLDGDDYDHYGDDEQEDEPEHEHSSTPLPSRQLNQPMPPQQQQQQQQQQPQPTSTSTLAPASGPFVAHVHFHSRVRITSGLRHSRGARAALGDSSDSDSPSSSISEPLRFRSHDSVSPMPLAERISRLAAKSLQKRRAAAAATASSIVSRLRAMDDNDYAPLLGAARMPVAYGAPQYGRTLNHHVNRDSDEPRDEDDIAFGRWPWRALNRRWWKWQIESTLRCCCSDEDESDIGE